MPRIVNNIICVSYSELVDSEIMTKDNYDKMRSRGRLKSIVRGGNGREAMIEFSSLPIDIKNSVVEMFGDPTKSYARDVFAMAVKTDYKARKYYSDYVLADGRFLPFEVQEQYGRNVDVMNVLIRFNNKSSAFQRALGGSARGLWNSLANTCNELSIELNHDLPRNPKRLRAKVRDYQRDGYVSLISGKFLNKNSAKVVDIEQLSTIRELLRKHNNFDNVQLANFYNFFGESQGWKEITPATIQNYREKFDLETAPFRKGLTHFDNTKGMIVKRSAPVLPLVYWSSDGWNVELVYQESVVRGGKSVTTYHNRLTCVVVLDACGKYPIGYAIGKGESAALIKAAHRNAVKHTEELFGRMHRVGQLQTDNYAKKALTPFYKALSGNYTPAKVGNAKAKIVEPYFKYLNKTYCQLLPNWSGFGVTSRKESQPNADWLNDNRHSIPSKEGVIEQIERIIEIERSRKVEAYVAAYQDLPEEERLTMSRHEYYLTLGETTGRTNSLSHEGLVLQIDNDKRVYDCFEADFRRNAHLAWTIHYDPLAREAVLAVNNDGSLRFVLNEKYVQPMALRDATEEDVKQLVAVREFNKSIKQHALDVFVEDAEVIDEMLSNRPELNDTLQKLILTDNHGQHKDNKQDIEKSKASRLTVSRLEKEAKENYRVREEERMQYLLDKIDVDSYLEED